MASASSSTMTRSTNLVVLMPAIKGSTPDSLTWEVGLESTA